MGVPGIMAWAGEKWRMAGKVPPSSGGDGNVWRHTDEALSSKGF